MSSKFFSAYDFIILGEHPAALWGAILLLQAGLRVLVVPLANAKTYLDRPLRVPKFALDAFDIPVGNRPRFDQDPMQILTPTRRFRIFSERAALEREFRFVYGSELSDLKVDEPLPSELARGLAYFYRGSETGPVFPSDLKAILQNPNQLVFFPSHTFDLTEKFFEKIKKLGGHIARSESIQRIFIEKKAFIGLQIEGSSSLIHGDQVWVATNWSQIQKYFSEPTSLESKPMGWRFNIEVTIENESVPLGVTSHMVFAQTHAPLIEIEFIQSSLAQFIFTTTLPFQEWTLNRTEQRKIAQRLFKVLSFLVPDLDYVVKKIAPDIRDPERAELEDLVERVPFRDLNSIPNSLLSYAAPGLNHVSPVKKMNITYSETYARLGEWGAYQAVQLSLQEWAKREQRAETFTQYLP